LNAAAQPEKNYCDMPAQRWVAITKQCINEHSSNAIASQLAGVNSCSHARLLQLLRDTPGTTIVS
jgi:hypothetical protein